MQVQRPATASASIVVLACCPGGIYVGARRMAPAARCMRRRSGARSHGARCVRHAAQAVRWLKSHPAWCAVARCASHAELDGDSGRCRRRACGALRSCSCAAWRRRRDPHGQGRRAVRRRGDIRHRSTSAHGRAAMRAGADARGRCGSGGGLGRRRHRVRRGCAQYGGGVVSMSDGAVTFKGGTITNTWAAVRTGHDPLFACWYWMPHVCE